MNQRTTQAHTARQPGRVYSFLQLASAHPCAGAAVVHRQAHAAKWAAGHNMPLGVCVPTYDEGLSSCHPQRIKDNVLGAFLQAIESGRVPPGSVLFIETFDGLAHACPLDAQRQLAQIINAGVAVVTASDGRAYNAESLAKDPMDFTYRVLRLIRVHEENVARSERIQAAYRKHRETWIAGRDRCVDDSPHPGQDHQQHDMQACVMPDPRMARARRRLVQLHRTGYALAQPAPLVVPLVGRAFVHGSQDCYGIVRDYYARELGVTLNDYPRHTGWWELEGGPDLYRDNFAHEGFVAIHEGPLDTEALALLQPHDLLLMRITAKRDNHMAVYLGNNMILHHLIDQLSRREVLRAFYRRSTTAVLRRLVGNGPWERARGEAESSGMVSS